jgi:hypothetical protein
MLYDLKGDDYCDQRRGAQRGLRASHCPPWLLTTISLRLGSLILVRPMPTH